MKKTIRRGEGVDRELRQFRSTNESGQHLLAMDPRALSLWYSGGFDENSVDENGIAVVSVCGPLEHHGGWWFDSYDAIVSRIEEAFANEATRAVVMCFDTPGGDASGVEEAHRKIKLLREQSGKPLFSYSNEACYSAGYWLACAADEIRCPVTGGVGSVGVIAQAVDCTEANAKAGVRVELVTTGARKADGHPDRELTPEILGVLQARVDQLGGIFFASVAESRGMKVGKVAALQAGVFLGEEAEASGLADGVAGWDEFLALVGKSISGVDAPTHGPVSMGGTAPNKAGSVSTDSKANDMKTKLLALSRAVKKAEAAVEAAKTTEERKAALASLKVASEAEAKMKYSKRTRTDEVEEDDGEDDDKKKDDDDSDDDAEDEESEESEDESKKAKKSKSEDEDADEEAEEEDAEDEESSDEDAEEEESKALASLTGKSAKSQVSRLYKAASTLTGQRTVGAILGALEGIGPRLKNAEKNEARIEKLEKAQVRKDVIAMLDKAGTKVTPAMRASLLKQGLKDPEWLKGHLASLPKQARSLDEGSSKPKTNADGSAAAPELDLDAMTKEEREMYEAGARAAGTTIEKFMASAKGVAEKLAARAPRH